MDEGRDEQEEAYVPVLLLWAVPAATSDTIWFGLFTERNYLREGKARVGEPAGLF